MYEKSSQSSLYKYTHCLYVLPIKVFPLSYLSMTAYERDMRYLSVCSTEFM